MVLSRCWAFLAVIVTSLSANATATSNNDQQYILAPVHPSTTISRSWNLNFSSSAPHYFASVQGLLQQWPNTFFPNGHSIVPCEIPPYTKFYHGRIDGDLPESPEWISFDIEMAYGIMGSTRNSHMLTYQTTRPTKAIYFDGESATLMGRGQLDTQMLQIYLNTTGKPWDPNGDRRFGLWAEYDRATGLCAWIKEKRLGGSGWGFEGIVRMNAGFEMIWCDFESPSLKLVSHLNVTAPLLPPVVKAEVKSETSYFPLPPAPTKSPVPADPMPPPNWRRDTEREPFIRNQGWGWFTSATNHYGFSGMGSAYGEVRAKPLTCAVLSYYSPIFESPAITRSEIERKSLNLTKEGLWIGPGEDGNRKTALEQLMRRRRIHRLDSVSISDASAMRTATELAFADLVNGTANCSGLDWTVLTNEIVQRHATDLLNFFHLLSNLEEDFKLKNDTELKSAMVEIRGKSHDFLLPFLEYPGSRANTDKTSIWGPSSTLSKETYARCRYYHTRLLTSESGIHLNPQEEMLKWAVEETFGGICAVLIEVGFGIEEIWVQRFGNSEEKAGNTDLANQLKWWREGVEELMSWLGWAGSWVRCEKQCEWDEKCFIPMWPLMARDLSPGGPPPHGGPPGGPHKQPGDNPDDREPLRNGPPLEGPPSSGLGEAPPPYGHGPGRGYGRRPGGGPGFTFDESDLWKPKCVKAEYIMG